MTIIFFIIGLLIGSFLNVVVYRLNAMETLMGRSHCPRCRRQIRWYDNIPVLSFVVLSAKCRDCGEKISWRYPVYELLTGVTFAIVGGYYFIPSMPMSWLTTAYYLIVFSLLIIIFAYDVQYLEIPMIILWSAVIITVAYLIAIDWNIFSLVGNYMDLQLISGIVAGAVAFVFFYALAAYSKETWMGMGDAYLGLLAGFMTGWPNIIVALMLSFTVGALVSVILLIFGKKTMKSQVPFAPFLVIGIAIVVFLPTIFPKLQHFLYYFS